MVSSHDEPYDARQDERPPRHCSTCKCPEHYDYEKQTAPLRAMFKRMEENKKRWARTPGVCNYCGKPTLSPTKECAACACGY